MADQSSDFEIKIRVNADTTQVETIRQSFQKLGAQVQVTNLQAQRAQAAAVGAGAGNAAELGRLLGTFTGVGIAGGIYAFVSSLKTASSEIAKISENLDKQGEQLLKHAQLYDEQSRHAQDVGDVLKVSDATLKDIETAQKTVTDLAKQELNLAAKLSDELQKQMLARQRAAGMGDYEAAQQENLKTATDQLMAARQTAMDELIKGETSANQTYEERVETLNNEIAAEEQRKQSALDNTDPGGYAKAGNNLLRLNKLLEETNRLEAQRRDKEQGFENENQREKEQDKDFVQEQVQRASPQARAILMNEQAAANAAAAGRANEADRFTRTAEQFRRSATPEQQSETAVLEKLIEQNGLLRELRDIWR